MILMQCPECGSNLSLPDQYAGQKGQCTRCGAPIEIPDRKSGQPQRVIVQGPILSVPTPPGPGAGTPGAVPASAGSGTGWYFLVNDVQNGPMEESALRNAFQSGHLAGSTPVWRPGLAAWVPAYTVESLGASQKAAVVSVMERDPTNKFAPAALVLAILGVLLVILLPVALPLGHIALSRWRKEPRIGRKRMAVAALVIGYAGLLINALALAALAVMYM